MGDWYFREHINQPNHNKQDKDVLRDSLDSLDESVVCSLSTVGNDNVMRQHDSDSHMLLVLQRHSNPEMDTVDKKQPSEMIKNPKKKGHQRDAVELNKRNVSNLKGLQKGSYSKMYQKKMQSERKQKSIGKNKEIVDNTREVESHGHTGLKQSSKKNHQSTIIIKANQASSVNQMLPSATTHNCNESDTRLQGSKNVKNNIKPVRTALEINKANREIQHKTAIAQEQDDSQYSTTNNIMLKNIVYQEQDKLMSMPDSHNNSNSCCQDKLKQDLNKQFSSGNLSCHRDLPGISDILGCVQSAPAHMEACNSGDIQCNVPYRSSSLCIPTCVKQDGSGINNSDKNPKSNGYGNMHTKKYTYKPYMMNDYKRLLHNTAPSGSLGPDTSSKEYSEKVKKAARIKQYSTIVRQKHSVSKTQWKTKPIQSQQDKINPKIRAANDRRKKALEYAKAVPKPVATMPRQVPPVKMNSDERPPQSLLDLMRERHEKEKKAVGAVKKDLETKLKLQSS